MKYAPKQNDFQQIVIMINGNEFIWKYFTIVIFVLFWNNISNRIECSTARPIDKSEIILFNCLFLFFGLFRVNHYEIRRMSE